jgi:hypothetical protein
MDAKASSRLTIGTFHKRRDSRCHVIIGLVAIMHACNFDWHDSNQRNKFCSRSGIPFLVRSNVEKDQRETFLLRRLVL